MTSGRLLAALLFLFVGLSALNYFYFHERMGAIMAPYRANPYIATLMGDVIHARLTKERDGLIYRETFLVLAAGVGIILLWRRDGIIGRRST